MSKTVLFQTIQFSISTQFKCENSKLSKPWFSYIWTIARTQSDATTPGQSGPGSNSNEGVLRISQSFSITGTSPSDFSESYPGHSFEGVLPLCRGAISVFYSPRILGNKWTKLILLHTVKGFQHYFIKASTFTAFNFFFFVLYLFFLHKLF